MIYEAVYIKWLDSEEHNGWGFKKDLSFELEEIETIGFIIEETSTSITICSHVSNQLCSPMTIPQSAILERTVVNFFTKDHKND